LKETFSVLKFLLDLNPSEYTQTFGFYLTVTVNSKDYAETVHAIHKNHTTVIFNIKGIGAYN
jgi:hypothetical protein